MKTIKVLPDNFIEIRFDFSWDIVKKVKLLPNAKYNTIPYPHWKLPPLKVNDVETIYAFAIENNFEIDKKIFEWFLEFEKMKEMNSKNLIELTHTKKEETKNMKSAQEKEDLVKSIVWTRLKYATYGSFKPSVPCGTEWAFDKWTETTNPPVRYYQYGKYLLFGLKFNTLQKKFEFTWCDLPYNIHGKTWNNIILRIGIINEYLKKNPSAFFTGSFSVSPSIPLDPPSLEKIIKETYKENINKIFNKNIDEISESPKYSNTISILEEISPEIDFQYDTTHSKYTESDDAFGKGLGLDRFPMHQKIANWYLLYLASIKTSDRYVHLLFNKKTQYLANQLSRYIDFACGGELCYAKTRMGVLKEFDCHSGERGGWYPWKDFRAIHGMKAIDDGIATFYHFSSGAYGGPKWAKALELLKQYLSGEIKQIQFVDTAISLHHNGGWLFNKWWDTPMYLNKVLDAGFKSDETTLMKYASPDITDIYKWAKEEAK